MNKILAIDDQEDNLVVYEAILSNYFPDFKLLKARSGKEGIEKALLSCLRWMDMRPVET